jgi:type VI secretion system secreted protein VgrG
MDSAQDASAFVSMGADSDSTVTVSPDKTHWISIELTDEQGTPVPDEMYHIELPDGSAVDGTLDSKGKARIDGIDAGNCKVTFPNLDKDVWRKK